MMIQKKQCSTWAGGAGPRGTGWFGVARSVRDGGGARRGEKGREGVVAVLVHEAIALSSSEQQVLTMSAREERDPMRWVEIEHEHYIPLPAHNMVQQLCETLPDDKAKSRFRKIALTLALLIKHQYHNMCEELKSSYEVFDPVNANMSFDLAPEECFMTVMEKANFSLLSAHELESAQAADYMFTLPIEISFNNLDDVMLGRFLSGYDWSGKGDLPEFAKNILLFKRGSGIDKTSQVLMFDKLDQWIVRGIDSLKQRFNKLRGAKEEEKAPVSAASEDNGADSASTSIHQTKWVERINLQTMELKFPTSFYTETEMQEPTYDRIIILYRPKEVDSKNVTNQIPPIYVKQFKHIPMADLDVVFPDKHVHMTTLDRLIFGVGIVLGIYLILSELFSLLFAEPEEASEEGAWGFLAVLMSVGVLVSKSVVSYQTSKERYHSLVTSSLYEKNMDSDRGVFFYLINSLEEQEFMETLLGYYALWSSGGMTELQLDEHCEQILKDRFAAEVDFEVGDSIEKMKQFGLLKDPKHSSSSSTDSDAVFEAVSLREAHTGLYEHWCAAVPKPKKKKSSSSSSSSSSSKSSSKKSSSKKHKRSSSHADESSSIVHSPESTDDTLSAVE